MAKKVKEPKKAAVDKVEEKKANGTGTGLNAKIRDWLKKGLNDESIIKKTAEALATTRPGKDEAWIRRRALSKLRYVQKQQQAA